MGSLEELFATTTELKELLNQPITSKNRALVIEQMNLLIVKRGRVMGNVEPPFTAEEKVLGEKVVIMNAAIQSKMTDVLDVLKVEMKQVQQQKKSNQNYLNPYKDVRIIDGMYTDQKK